MKNHKWIWGHGAVATGLLLMCSSCALTSSPEHEVVLPEQYRQVVDGSELATDWWTAFGDDQLNALVATALTNNLSLEQADARLRQAQALAVKSGAARFPSLTGSGSGGTTQSGSQGGSTISTDEFKLGLNASYELDLWGRVASVHKATLSTVAATQYDLQTAAMTVSAETVRSYFLWQQLSGRLDLLNEQLDARNKMLSVINERFSTSQSDALDVLRQREQVAAAEAALPPVKDLLQSTGNAIAILTGRPPQADLGLEQKALPALPARPAAGLPADLLLMRPDLQAAWAEVESGDWDVRAARAARMPTISLTGSISTSDENVDDLFDSWVGNLLAGLTVPLIDGGSLRAEVRRTEAAADESIAAYQEAVYNALAEVENALSSENNQQVELAAITRQREFSEATADEAYRRYTRGLETYYDALSSRTTSQGQEINELIAQYDLVAARVQLCRVLGGDWKTFMEKNNEEK